MQFKITPILSGEFGMVRDDIKYLLGNPKIQNMVPSYVYLLDSGEEQYLVDTGFTDCEICMRETGLIVKREYDFYINLQKHGVCINKLKGIIITHLHWDHAGNCALFPEIPLYCQEKELEAAKAANLQQNMLLAGFFAKPDRICGIRGDNTICSGIQVHLCGGHTCGSQMVLVDTSEGGALITGDVVMTCRNLLENIPVGLSENEQECREALVYAAQTAYRYIMPSHDYLSIYDTLVN